MGIQDFVTTYNSVDAICQGFEAVDHAAFPIDQGAVDIESQDLELRKVHVTIYLEGRDQFMGGILRRRFQGRSLYLRLFLNQARAYIGDEVYIAPWEATGGKCFQQDARVV